MLSHQTMARIQRNLNRAWNQRSIFTGLLWPISLLFRALVALRYCGYQRGILRRREHSLPVIVVGNLTVGGTGKTPLVIALVKALQAAGYTPGVVSRGYGSKNPKAASRVQLGDTAGAGSRASDVGDEPLLIASRCQVPVAVAANRNAAIDLLLTEQSTLGTSAGLQQPIDVIISDDGLQHYAMGRAIEIMLVDGERLFGNGLCLPAGPLREPLSRLRRVDFLVVHAEDSPSTLDEHGLMRLRPITIQADVPTAMLVNVAQPTKQLATTQLNRQPCIAIAGIASPDRFFSQLKQLGFTATEYAFPDHHNYSEHDLQFAIDKPLLMTEKDAVKIRQLFKGEPPADWWYLPVNAELSEGFLAKLLSRLRTVSADR